MSIFPILAAAAPATFPSPGSASQGVSEDNTNFSHVLQQLGTGASSSANSGTDVTPAELSSFPNALAGAVSVHDKAAILRQVSATPSSLGAATDANRENAICANSLAASRVKSAETGDTGILPGVETKKIKAGGKNVPLHAQANVKQAVAKASPSGESEQSNTAATPVIISAVAVPMPDEASLLATTLASAESAVTSQQACGTQLMKIPLDRLSSSNSESAASPANAVGLVAENALSGETATVSPADVSGFSKESSLAADSVTVADNSASAGALAAKVQASAGVATAQSMLPALVAENATRAIFSTIAATDEVKTRAKPQAAISSGKAGGVAESASGNESASTFQVSAQFANLHSSGAREDFMQGNSPGNDSMLSSGADSSSRQAKIRSKSETASQDDSSSASPEKSASASGEHDANTSLASEGSAHTFSFQPAVVPPAAASTPASASADAAQSAAYSASAVPSQTSRDATPSATQPQHQPQSNSLPYEHHMVDSGQLRISGNSSELKVSVQLPELGKVEVRAVTSHDVTTAHLTAAHRDALQVLSADRTGLEQALKSRDVILGTLDSHTQRHAAGQQHQQNSQSSAQSSGGASSATAVTSSAMEEAGSVGFLPDYSSISVRA